MFNFKYYLSGGCIFRYVKGRKVYQKWVGISKPDEVDLITNRYFYLL